MMSLFLIALGVWELRRRKVGQPQIVLNARGIQLAGHDFYEWEYIKYERVAPSGSSTYVLAFTNKGQSISFPIFDLKVEVETLEKMLVFYRKSYAAQH